jgi:hypothetical protein
LGSGITSSSLTSLGTLTSLTVAGTTTTANLTVSGNLNATITTPAQPNITSLGSLTSLTTSGLDANGYSLELISYGLTTATSSSVAFKSSRGTSSSPSAVQTNDVLGNQDFYGYFNGAFIKAASMQFSVTGTPAASTSFPAQISWNFTNGPASYNAPVSVATLNNSGTFTATTINATNSVTVNGLNLKSFAVAMAAAFS